MQQRKRVGALMHVHVCVLDRERNRVFAIRALVVVFIDGSVPDQLQ